MKKFEKFMSDKDRMLQKVKEESQKDITVSFLNIIFVQCNSIYYSMNYYCFFYHNDEYTISFDEFQKALH